MVYCSATGASEPRNMGYMTRLGLWGHGTSFTDLSNFLGTTTVYLIVALHQDVKSSSSSSMPLSKIVSVFIMLYSSV